VIGIWVGLAALLGVSFGPAGWSLVVIGGVVVWFGLRQVIPGARRRCFVLAVLVGFAGLGMIREAAVIPPPSLTQIGTLDRLEGRIVSPVQTDLRFQHIDLQLTRVRADDVWIDVVATVRVTAPASPTLGYGDLVGLTGDLDPSEDSEVGYRSYLLQQRISGSVFARTIWVEQPGSGFRRALYGFGADLAERLRRAVPGDSGILLGGLVVGDDRALSDDLTLAFRQTGMSHITAVSGSNLALVVVLLMAVGGPIGLRRRVIWLLAVTVAIWLYAAVTGLEPPVVRAALMATIALLAIPFGRRVDYLTAAVLSAAVMALNDPGLIHDIGFQLSLAASVALAAVAAGVSISSPAGAVRLAINGSIVAQIATLPVTLAAFGGVSLVSIPLNLIVGPLVGIAFPVAFAGALLGIVSPAPGDALISTAGWLGNLILLIIDVFARLPFANVSVPALTTTGQVGLLLVSLVVILLVSGDGRRWGDRLTWPGRSRPVAPKPDSPR